jgi:hypothetical protein
MIDLSAMPRTIESSVKEKYEVFKKSWTFETSGEETISALASLASAHQFSKGEIIFREDDPCRFFLAGGVIFMSLTVPNSEAFAVRVTTRQAVYRMERVYQRRSV